MSNANMVPGKRSKGAGCLRWLGRVVLGGVILLLGLAVIGTIYQGIASARDAKLYKPVDQMVDVNGIQMRLDCRGSGSPTVVLEAGAQSSSVVWIRTQDDVTKFTRVCSYDRAGYGWSDAIHEALYPRQVAEMLHDLLENGGEGPPYLMVGHSLGGVYVRAFTEKYPDEVVGMVLVDSSHEKQDEQLPPVLAELNDPKLVKTGLQIQQIIASIGLLRAFKLLDASNPPILLTEEEKGPALAEMYRTGYFGAYARETEMMLAYFSLPRKLNSLGDMPLIVVSAEMNAQEMYAAYENAPQIQSQLSVEMMQQYADFLNGLQDELAALSTRSRHIIVKDSGHFIQLDAPQVVIDAVREVFEQVPR
jgi:pimeloyl-ACP methyl ester carboxylesterase